MARRIVVKRGDVFEVKLNNNKKGYFQFIMLDTTQLNSEVIRVFKRKYEINENPNLNDIIESDIDFYAHVIIKFGIKMNLWRKIGNIPISKNITNPSFRDTKDYGTSNIEVSNKWFKWKANESFIEVGILNEDETKLDIGIVVTPLDIVDKMNTGKYNFVYPKYL
ncbi:Imm26 family immunity protein [uncultured Psychroserpens sp.]|uniref:Imm26 family immunity protein n=1 Tax=uncultured Psychroserpens sp. TaxID=255436 RepID=UPI0026101031|nr:Imm26 family immunity protein [uncultured Psychroserpens sp.]